MENGEWRKLHFENIDFFQGERRNGGFLQRKKNGEWHPPKTYKYGKKCQNWHPPNSSAWKSWDWVRPDPSPPRWDKIPTLTKILS